MHLHTGAKRQFARKSKRADRRAIPVCFFDQTCQIGLGRIRRQINTPNNSASGARDRGLPRPLLCSGIDQTTTVFGDYPDHYCARGLLRPR